MVGSIMLYPRVMHSPEGVHLGIGVEGTMVGSWSVNLTKESMII
jgi:hypothetical protein